MITSVAYIISLANVYGHEKKRLGFGENETSNFAWKKEKETETLKCR